MSTAEVIRQRALEEIDADLVRLRRKLAGVDLLRCRIAARLQELASERSEAERLEERRRHDERIGKGRRGEAGAHL
jgi:hypothetical protein